MTTKSVPVPAGLLSRMTTMLHILIRPGAQRGKKKNNKECHLEPFWHFQLPLQKFIEFIEFMEFVEFMELTETVSLWSL